jgi:two-component system response regulator DegU
MDNTAPHKINVLLVDDHAIMRSGLRKLLELEQDITVVAEASSGEQALEIVQKLKPQVVVLDINLPTLNGLQVTDRIKAQHAELAVVLLTAYDDAEQELHAMRSGASAYCPKAIEPEKLFDVIRQAAQGKFVVGGKTYSERGIQDWIHRRANPDEEGEHGMPLSPREMEILRCVTRGLSNKAIALELGISHQTVRNHMTSIIHKLNVRGRTEAAIYALKRGWVRAQDYHPPTEE